MKIFEFIFFFLEKILIALHNFNSAFAILSGLGNVAVTRMTQTWKVNF